MTPLLFGPDSKRPFEIIDLQPELPGECVNTPRVKPLKLFMTHIHSGITPMAVLPAPEKEVKNCGDF